MGHTRQSHRDLRSTPDDTSLSPTIAPDDGGTRRDSLERPPETYRPSGRRHRYSGDRRSRPLATPSSGTSIQPPPRTYLPRYEPYLGSMGTSYFAGCERLTVPRTPGSEGFCINTRYESGDTAQTRRLSINKNAGQSWFSAALHPQLQTEQDQLESRRHNQRSKKPRTDDRSRYDHVDKTGRSREKRESTKRYPSNHSPPRRPNLTKSNVASHTRRQSSAYDASLGLPPTPPPVTKMEFPTTPRKLSTPKKYYKDPRKTQGSSRKVQSTPETDRKVRRGEDYSRYRDGEISRGRKTRPSARCGARTAFVNESEGPMADHYPPCLPDNHGRERSRPTHTRTETSDEYSSSPERTNPRGRQPTHRKAPREGSHSSYEKSRRKITYPEEPGCRCTIL